MYILCSGSEQYMVLCHPCRAFMASSRHVASHTTIGELLKCWFGNVKESDIKRDNVADLLCYGFWYR